MQRIALFLFCIFSLFGTSHYDCIFVGTSPLTLFEALYQHALGKSVLILEEAPCCGGAWQSVDICGVQHADVGCHEIGNSESLKEFLEKYGGCTLCSLDMNNGFYFSKGCYELVHNLECRIQHSSIHLLKNHKVNRVLFNPASHTAIVESQGEQFTCEKVFAPSYSYFSVGDGPHKEVQKTQYLHLYLLICDPTPARFAYRNGGACSTRMMNLTHFVGLAGTGQQLIVFQTWNASEPGENFLKDLKTQGLIDASAYILKADWFTYEQYPANAINAQNNPCIERLQTLNFRDICHHIDRWIQVMAPYAEAVLFH